MAHKYSSKTVTRHFWNSKQVEGITHLTGEIKYALKPVRTCFLIFVLAIGLLGREIRVGLLVKCYWSRKKGHLTPPIHCSIGLILHQYDLGLHSFNCVYMCKQLSILCSQYGRYFCFILDCFLCFVSFSAELCLLQYFKVLGGLEGRVLEIIGTICSCWNLIYFFHLGQVKGTNYLTVLLTFWKRFNVSV